ncbi:HNH endonuclease [Planctomycetales bacterium ZRK34]|nr:HNH endonuclease [Planctomycetales bacterium ZRK34]
MPYKPKRPCRRSHCSQLTTHRTGYCEKHLAEVRAEYDKYRRADDHKFYTCAAWRKLRALKLKRQPLCEQCDREGRTTLATVVDHMTPRSKRKDLELAWSNLQSLCERCHNVKTAKEQKERGVLFGER